MFDKDGDGLISVREVHETVKSLGFHIELPRVKLMVKHVDTDGMCRCFFSLELSDVWDKDFHYPAECRILT